MKKTKQRAKAVSKVKDISSGPVKDKDEDLTCILAELAVLSKVGPRAPASSVNGPGHPCAGPAVPVEAPSVTSAGNTATVSGGVVWAKGTGFGANAISGSHFDPFLHAIARKQEDLELCVVLQRLVKCIALRIMDHLCLPDSDNILGGVYEELEASCILPLVAMYLANDSLLDMGRQSLSYTIIFSFLGVIAKASPLLQQLFELPVVATVTEGGTDTQTLRSLSSELYGRILAYFRQQQRAGLLDKGPEWDNICAHLAGTAPVDTTEAKTHTGVRRRVSARVLEQQLRGMSVPDTKSLNSPSLPVPVSAMPKTPATDSGACAQVDEMLKQGLEICHLVASCRRPTATQPLAEAPQPKPQPPTTPCNKRKTRSGEKLDGGELAARARGKGKQQRREPPPLESPEPTDGAAEVKATALAALAAEAAEYSAAMADIQFSEAESFAGFHYRPLPAPLYSTIVSPNPFTASSSSSSANTPQAAGVPNRARARRIAQEQSDLSRPGTLPLSLGSSVWMRVCADRMDWCKAMISGPVDTPYENGLFVFDIYLPPEYPREPPKVNLQTTGYGTVRFNPNLYNCGKVCLSLLGTWSGTQGESWSEQSSTLLQVLVSIQSLILVEEPFFNEPSFERAMGTAEGSRQSDAYNEIIILGTLEHAMLGYLERSAPPEYAAVTKHHFTMKRDIIRAQIAKWHELFKRSGTTSSHLSRFVALSNRVEAALAAL